MNETDIFCRISSLLQGSFAKESYHFKEPTNRSHPILIYVVERTHLRWLRLVGSFKLYVSFEKEPYKRDDILEKRPVILRSLLIVATPQSLYIGSLYIYVVAFVLLYNLSFRISFIFAYSKVTHSLCFYLCRRLAYSLSLCGCLLTLVACILSLFTC